MEHHPQAAPIIEEEGQTVGYDAYCSCRWRGRPFFNDRFSLAYARTCAMLVATAHSETANERESQ